MNKTASTVLQKLKKFKYPLIVVLIGIVILLLPTKREEQAPQQPVSEKTSFDRTGEEERLAAILRQVDGAGNVSVMLTLQDGGCTEYQTDSQTTARDGSSELRTETVFSGGSQAAALICRVKEPSYRGAVVVSGGAGNAQVRLDLIRAVACLTGLTSDKITVLKMKG